MIRIFAYVKWKYLTLGAVYHNLSEFFVHATFVQRANAAGTLVG